MALTKPSSGILDIGEVFANIGNVKVFSTQALAEADSPGEDILALITLGVHADPTVQGGAAYWRYNPNFTHGWGIVTANGRKYELSVDVADVKIFGAKGNGTGDDSTAIQKAINYAKMRLPYQTTVYVPPGIFHIATPLVYDFAMTFLGAGRSTELRGINLTSAMFLANLNTAANAQINFGEIGNFHASLYLSGGTPQTASVINVSGPANSYWQWNHVHDILSAGFYAFLTVNAESHVTPFGNEGPASWNTFSRIVFANASGYSLYGFMFNTGSGTGNIWSDCGGFIHNWGWLYQSAGGSPRVVGDIVIRGGQWGSYNTRTSRIFVVGANAQYRSRIRIQGLQADAGMAGILQIDGSSGNYYEMIVDVTRGGATIMGNYPTLYNSSLGFSKGTVPAA